jgi:serine/threonine protein kinase
MQERYFTHRDLKPDNLFLDGDGGVLRILDTGLACHNVEVLDTDMRRAGWSKPCQDLSLQCAATEREPDYPGPWLGCSFKDTAGNKRYRSPHVHFSAGGVVKGAQQTAVMGAVAAKDLRLLEGVREPRTRGIQYWPTIAMTRGHDSE